MKQAAGILALIVLAFIAVTWWALESGGVAIAETLDAAGTPRSTHIWYADIDGTIWVEAGTPLNPWFVDLQANPMLTLTADEHSGRYRAHPVPDASAHGRLRASLREKYGLRDVWLGLLVDTSKTVAIRLEPADEARWAE